MGIPGEQAVVVGGVGEEIGEVHAEWPDGNHAKIDSLVPRFCHRATIGGAETETGSRAAAPDAGERAIAGGAVVGHGGCRRAADRWQESGAARELGLVEGLGHQMLAGANALAPVHGRGVDAADQRSQDDIGALALGADDIAVAILAGLHDPV